MVKSCIVCVFALLASSAFAAEPELIFHSKFDSAADILGPTFGPKGVDHQATFVPGKFGQAIHVPAHLNVAEFPFNQGFPETCTIDFWAKICNPRDYFRDGADPYLFIIAKGYEGVASIVFEVNYNSNNGCGQCGLFCGMTYGRALVVNRGTKFANYLGSAPKDWHRYTVRWNCAGLDGTANIMELLIDGKTVGAGISDPQQVATFRQSLKQPLKLIFSNLDEGHGGSAIEIDEVKIYATDRHVQTVIGNSRPTTSSPKKPRVIAVKDKAEVLRRKRLAAEKATAAAAANGMKIASVPDWAAGTFAGGGEKGSALFIVDKSGLLAGRWTTAEKVWKMKAASFGAYDATNEVCAVAVALESNGETMTKILNVTPKSAICEDFEAWACEWEVNPAWKSVMEKLSGKVAEFDEEGTTVQLEIGAAGFVKVALAKNGVVRTCESMLIPVEGRTDEYRIFVAVPADGRGFKGFASEFVLNISDFAGI